MSHPDCVVIGAAIVDVPLSPVDPGIFSVHSTQLERIELQVGGDAANEARTLARLGRSPALLSAVGQDMAGDFTLAELRAAGVDVSLVTRSADMDTGVNVVLVRPDGERGFVTSRAGSLRRLALEHVLPALDSPALAGARVACLASLFVSTALDLPDTLRLFDALKARGLTLCADATRRKRGETLREAGEALSRLDYFFPNLQEAALLTGEPDPDAAARALVDCGVKHAVIKLGAGGCLLRSREERHLVPACPGARCVDTTGAGDTFAGAFIAALLEGRSFAECGRFANAAASLCVEHVGAAGGRWTRRDVEARLRGDL